MKATKNAHDWSCEAHGTYGWRGESCRQCPEAPSEIAELKRQLEAARKDRDGLLNLLIGAETLFACICSDSTASNWLDDSRAAIEQASSCNELHEKGGM